MKFSEFDKAVYKKCSEPRGRKHHVSPSLTLAVGQPIPSSKSVLRRAMDKLFEVAHSNPELMDKLEAERIKILAGRVAVPAGVAVPVGDDSDAESTISSLDIRGTAGIGRLIYDSNSDADSILSDVYSMDSVEFLDFLDGVSSSYSSDDDADPEEVAFIRDFGPRVAAELDALNRGIITNDRFNAQYERMRDEGFPDVETAFEFDPITGRNRPTGVRQQFMGRRIGGAPIAVPAAERQPIGVIEQEEVIDDEGEEMEFAFTAAAGPRLAVAPRIPVGGGGGVAGIDITPEMANPFMDARG